MEAEHFMIKDLFDSLCANEPSLTHFGRLGGSRPLRDGAITVAVARGCVRGRRPSEELREICFGIASLEEPRVNKDRGKGKPSNAYPEVGSADRGHRQSASNASPVVPAVLKAVEIIRLLNNRGSAGASLPEIVAQLNITRSHCHNILRTLVHCHWLDYDFWPDCTSSTPRCPPTLRQPLCRRNTSA